MFRSYLSIFILGQLVLYTLMFTFRGSIPFKAADFKAFHNKYFGQSERSSVPENLLENFIVYDAQWYLKIAENGYISPSPKDIANPSENPNILQFAFFPLYPLILSLLYTRFQDIETAAVICSLILQFIAGVSMFFLIKTMINEKIAYTSSLLLFFFPVSIFFRAYYTEILFLVLLSWFCFFTYRRQFLIAGIVLGLLLVTRGTGMLLLPLFAILLHAHYKKSLLYIVLLLFIAVIPLLLWMYYCYAKTGDPVIFLTVQKYWARTDFPFLRTIQTFGAFPFLPNHGFHGSKIDSTMIVLIGFILYKSKKVLHPLLWWVSFCLWITPLLSHDTMSFSRYQSVNFPLFVYIAGLLNQKLFIYTFGIFFILLSIVSILFLNYYWIG